MKLRHKIVYLEKEQILAPIFDFHKYGHFMCRVVHCLVNACQGTCWLHTWSKADKIMNKVRMEAHCSPLIINMFAESPLACLTMDGAKRKFQETGRNYHGFKSQNMCVFFDDFAKQQTRTYPVHHHELNGKNMPVMIIPFSITYDGRRIFDFFDVSILFVRVC